MCFFSRFGFRRPLKPIPSTICKCYICSLWLLFPIFMGLAAGCGRGASNSHHPPSSLSYQSTKISATVGTAVTSDVPTVSGSVDSYSISPALPAGITLSASTGAIAGTPTPFPPSRPTR